MNRAKLEQMRTESLTWAELRAANVCRLPRFTNSHGHPVHTEPDGSDWTPLQWWIAMAGEMGELGNVIKKSWRGDKTPEEIQRGIEDEWADVVIYLDILAYQYRITICRYGSEPAATDATPGARSAALPRFIAAHEAISHMGDELRYGSLRCRDVDAVCGALESLASALSIEPTSAIRRKFNEVSDRIGCSDVKL